MMTRLSGRAWPVAVALIGCGGNHSSPSNATPVGGDDATTPPVVSSAPAAATLVPPDRCGSANHPWRYLPAKEFSNNTVVDDECIKLPSNHTTRIPSGITLVIIARRGLSVEGNVSLDARGVDGPQGAGGEEQIFPAGPGNDADSCLCSGSPDVNAKTCGKMGPAGTPAGNVIILARGIEVAPGTRFSLDVSGGLQGKQGNDSRIHCVQFNPARRFATGCCKSHPDRANAGDGRLIMQLDGTSAVKAAFQGASKPQKEPIMLTAARAWEDAAEQQLRSSISAGWPALAAAAQPPPP